MNRCCATTRSHASSVSRTLPNMLGRDRVIAKQPEHLDPAAVVAVEDGARSRTRRRWRLGSPNRLQRGARCGVRNRPVAGQAVRQHAHVADALEIVVFGQRKESRAGLANLAGQQREIDNGPDGVLAAGLDAGGIQNRGGLGTGVGERRGFDGFRRDTAFRRRSAGGRSRGPLLKTLRIHGSVPG